jgi:hypothetical protein
MSSWALGALAVLAIVPDAYQAGKLWMEGKRLEAAKVAALGGANAVAGTTPYGVGLVWAERMYSHSSDSDIRAFAERKANRVEDNLPHWLGGPIERKMAGAAAYAGTIVDKAGGRAVLEMSIAQSGAPPVLQEAMVSMLKERGWW